MFLPPHSNLNSGSNQAHYSRETASLPTSPLYNERPVWSNEHLSFKQKIDKETKIKNKKKHSVISLGTPTLYFHFLAILSGTRCALDIVQLLTVDHLLLRTICQHCYHDLQRKGTTIWPLLTRYLPGGPISVNSDTNMVMCVVLVQVFDSVAEVFFNQYHCCVHQKYSVKSVL